MSEAGERTEVLDASALLAWLQAEPGADEVVLKGALMNSVNWSEVVQKAEQNGVEIAGVREELEALGLVLQAFSLEEGQKAAELYAVTKPHGLSLADRACLATALLTGGVAVTTERVWARIRGSSKTDSLRGHVTLILNTLILRMTCSGSL